ncbi:hypothetical protein [Natronosalvus amylolyticus]|uniref:hypothetical protein n=1 Tax=Natronosalvus amylolyticus TaxID=2961994 RepID=UPI0020C97BC6|nr:hypothetical protein [Natronosalvus amylolyticus]
MGSSSLRRTRIPGNGQRFRELSDLSTNGFSLSDVNERKVSGLCDDYPFDGQMAYSGLINYSEDAMWGGGRDIELEFEFRDQSNLFILDTEVDLPSVESVIQKLNTLSSDDVKIYRSLTVHRERLWNFLNNADKIIELTLIGDQGKEISFEELDSGLEIEQYPIESATVVFSYEGEQILTRYTDGTLSVQSDVSEATEYLVQLFERDVIAESGD